MVPAAPVALAVPVVPAAPVALAVPVAPVAPVALAVPVVPSQSGCKRAATPSQCEIVHCPVFSNVKRNCVVCYKQGRGQLQIYSYCSAPQCGGKHMHITKEKNCFKEFHSIDYQQNCLFTFSKAKQSKTKKNLKKSKYKI